MVAEPHGHAAFPACTTACDAPWHDPVSHEAYGLWLGVMVAEYREPPRIIRTGPLVVDRLARTATVDGQACHLTPREADLLLYLAARIGEHCPNDDILRGAWGPEYVLGNRYARPGRGGSINADWNVLRATLNRMRAKLGPAAALIVTSCRGRRLVQLPPLEDV